MVLATETPVPVYEMGRGVVDEVIHIDGMHLPSQVPLLDSHQRGSVRSVLGSIRELRREDGRVVGRAFFASDSVSRQVFENYADGHIDSFSVGAEIQGAHYEDDGERKIIDRSSLIEGSAVVVGADPNARTVPALRAYQDPYSMRDEEMFEELKRKAVENGCDPKATDQEVLDWYLERVESASDDGDVDELKHLQREAKEFAAALKQLRKSEPNVERKTRVPEPDEPVENTITEEQELKFELNRRDRIEYMCRKHGISDELRRKWIEKGYTIDRASAEYLELTNPHGGAEPIGLSTRLEHGKSEREKVYEAMRGGLLLRALGSHERVKKADPDFGENISVDSDRFRNRRVPDLAREFCERAGHRIGDEPDHEIVRKALRVQSFVERSDSAYHTTGNFANLFLDAMNKTLRMAYEEAPSTYQLWTSEGTPASDYKALHRIVMGEFNLPSEVPENTEYPEMTTSDSRENYRVAKHGGVFSISMEMLVNDDLDAMTRIPRKQGAAMRRKINRDVYSVLIDNAALADGIALFHASSHNANLDATALAAGAPLNVGYQVMATQSGTDSTTVLGITPRYLIVPEALAATALQVTSDMFYPATAATIGLYGPNGPRTLQVVADGQIDNLGSATNWWLAASPSVVDTVEVTFLQGEQSPVLDREEGFTTDTIKYKIRQSYGVKAIDYRGLYQGNS